MTKKPGKGKGKSHPETTNDRPGDSPQAAKEEARELRPNPETRSGDGDSSENILESEFESTNERDTEPLERKGPPLTEPADNARVDRVIARARAIEGTVALVAHAHLLRILTARWLDQPAAFGRHLTLDPAGWALLAWERETPVIDRWNPPKP